MGNLRVIGAGVGRTGTASLKQALEELLGAPCYHMTEVFVHLDEHTKLWHAASRGEPVDWSTLFDGYVAAVDWPVAAFWPELVDAYPDALVLLSQRDSASWWRSASTTILPTLRDAEGELPDWYAMMSAIFASRFTADLDDEAACIAAYEAHNARVIAEVPAERLLVWTPSDGWEPICAALGLAVPDAPFPRTNTSEEWEESRAAEAERAPDDGPA